MRNQPVDAVTIFLDRSLTDICRRRFAGAPPIRLPLGRRTSVKDLVESLGIPHTEIDQLRVNGREVSFAARIRPGDRLGCFGMRAPIALDRSTSLRPALSGRPRFLVDVNVAKLAGLLRLAGFDTHYDPKLDDAALAELACRQRRILLTRDRGLLMRKAVVYGRLIRNHLPQQQLVEVVKLYGLTPLLQPFSRCLACNGRLTPVAKERVVARLQPLTRKYYNDFYQCGACRKIYWQGSHLPGLQKVLAGLKGQ